MFTFARIGKPNGLLYWASLPTLAPPQSHVGKASVFGVIYFPVFFSILILFAIRSQNFVCPTLTIILSLASVEVAKTYWNSHCSSVIIDTLSQQRSTSNFCFSLQLLETPRYPSYSKNAQPLPYPHTSPAERPLFHLEILFNSILLPRNLSLILFRYDAQHRSFNGHVFYFQRYVPQLLRIDELTIANLSTTS